MTIRKGKPEDMKGVLALIQELADYEKEPNAVVITVDDLIRDGFGTHPLFHVFVAEVDDDIVGIALYYYRYSTWKGKTIHEKWIIKEASDDTGWGTRNGCCRPRCHKCIVQRYTNKHCKYF